VQEHAGVLVTKVRSETPLYKSLVDPDPLFKSLVDPDPLSGAVKEKNKTETHLT
jgi:hypothetical protein